MKHDMREIQAEAAKRKADPYTVLVALENGTLEHVGRCKA